jgi:hypothetical protein
MPRYDNYYDSEDRSMFANPGGNSALRAVSRRNPRNLPCPTCGEPNRLTPADKRRGYQCDSCADAAEGCW